MRVPQSSPASTPQTGRFRLCSADLWLFNTTFAASLDTPLKSLSVLSSTVSLAGALSRGVSRPRPRRLPPGPPLRPLPEPQTRQRDRWGVLQDTTSRPRPGCVQDADLAAGEGRITRAKRGNAPAPDDPSPERSADSFSSSCVLHGHRYIRCNSEPAVSFFHRKAQPSCGGYSIRCARMADHLGSLIVTRALYEGLGWCGWCTISYRSTCGRASKDGDRGASRD